MNENNQLISNSFVMNLNRNRILTTQFPIPSENEKIIRFVTANCSWQSIKLNMERTAMSTRNGGNFTRVQQTYFENQKYSY